MDRQIVYPGSVPLDTDLLNAGRNAKKGLGRLAFLLFGEVSAAQGFIIALSSTDLTATVGEGTVISTGPIDQMAIGGLGGGLDAVTDTGVNQFDSWVSQTVTLTAGATNTIWAVCSESDSDDAVLPFYNSENPSQALAGSANTGANLPTQRQARVSIVCATTAPEVPDGGAVVGLYSVIVPSSAANLAGLTATPQQAFYPTIPELMRGRLLGTYMISASTTYLPSRWAKTLRVSMIGGGGAGGGAYGNVGTNCSVGGAGAAGGYAEFLVSLTTLPGPFVLTVGAGGTGMQGGGGGTGGSSSFGTYVTCTGGQGGSSIGFVAAGSGSWGNQANGGTVSVNQVAGLTMVQAFQGDNGQSPFVSPNFNSSGSAQPGIPIPPIGASSRFGSGGGNGIQSGATDLTGPPVSDRGSFGAGGGGTGSTSSATMAWANGAPGIIRIEEYS